MWETSCKFEKLPRPIESDDDYLKYKEYEESERKGFRLLGRRKLLPSSCVSPAGKKDVEDVRRREMCEWSLACNVLWISSTLLSIGITILSNVTFPMTWDFTHIGFLAIEVIFLLVIWIAFGRALYVSCVGIETYRPGKAMVEYVRNCILPRFVLAGVVQFLSVLVLISEAQNARYLGIPIPPYWSTGYASFGFCCSISSIVIVFNYMFGTGMFKSSDFEGRQLFRYINEQSTTEVGDTESPPKTWYSFDRDQGIAAMKLMLKAYFVLATMVLTFTVSLAWTTYDVGNLYPLILVAGN